MGRRTFLVRRLVDISAPALAAIVFALGANAAKRIGVMGFSRHGYFRETTVHLSCQQVLENSFDCGWICLVFSN
jgi:hypothetical protein